MESEELEARLPPSDEDWVEVVAKAIHGRSEYWPSGDDGENEMYREQAQRALTALTPLLDKVREEALEEAADCQPSTAENPNEDAYQRGRFDGIMEFAKAIRSLSKSPIEGEGGQ